MGREGSGRGQERNTQGNRKRADKIRCSMPRWPLYIRKRNIAQRIFESGGDSQEVNCIRSAKTVHVQLQKIGENIATLYVVISFGSSVFTENKVLQSGYYKLRNLP